MSENYTIPFSVDGGAVLKGFQDMSKGSEKLGQDTEKASRDMQAAFDKAAGSGAKLKKELDGATISASSLLTSATRAGQQIGEALSGKGINSKFEIEINRVRRSLESVASKTVFLDVDFDQKKIVALEQQIAKAASAQDEFNAVISFGKDQLSKMEAGGESYRQLANDIKKAESMVQMLADSQNKVIPQTQLLTDKFDNLMGDPSRFLSTKQMEELDKAVQGSSTEVGRLEAMVKSLDGELNTLDPKSDKFQELTQVLDAGKEAMKSYGSEFVSVATAQDETATKTQTLRGRILELKNDMAQLSANGEGGSEAFAAMAEEAGNLQESVNAVNQQVNTLGSTTSHLDAGIQAVQGLAGAFAIGQGAVALFGGESEKTQLIIQKVTGALAILQGVQSLATILTKESALATTVLTLLRRNNAVATVELAAAETAEATAATAAAAATGAAAVAEEAATVATVSWTAALLANPIFLIATILAGVVVALYAFTSGTNEAKDAVESFNEELELQNRILTVNEAALNRATNEQIARARKAGATESEISKIEIGALKERVAGRKEYAKLTSDQYEEYRALDDADEKTSKEYYDRSLSANQQYLDVSSDLTIKEIDQQTQAATEKKTASEKAAAAEEKARNKRLADQRRNAAEQKKISDQILKFAKEAATAEVSAMAEGVQKQEAELRNRVKAQIAALNAEVVLTKKAGELRTQAIVNINKQLESDLAKLAIEEANRKAELQLNANSVLADLYKEGVDRELMIQEASYQDKRKQIELQYKDELVLRNLLLDSLTKQNGIKQKEIKVKGAQDSLAIEEENAVIGIELMSKYSVVTVKTEEAKQQEILRVQLEYAHKRLALIEDDGTKETGLKINKAKKEVSDLEKALGVSVKTTGKKTDIFDLMGITGLDDSDKDLIGEFASKSLQSLSEITSVIGDLYQKQIDKKQEVIDQYDQELDDLEGRLDKEKELRENGFANNVELLESEIAAKKLAKEEEIRQQEELQKKQQALQKAQLVVDTAVQASNLIVAATSIFKTFATIPFGLGIPLAIATVGLMTGAFVAGKVKAFQAVNDGGQKFGEGGEIDGAAHSQGGVKYRSMDSKAGVVELEGGEYVIKKAAYRKHPELTRALNSDRITDMSDAAMAAFLNSLGISMANDAPSQSMATVSERDALQVNNVLNVASAGVSSGDLKGIQENVGYLAKARMESGERWEDSKFYYHKLGNKLTKSKK